MQANLQIDTILSDFDGTIVDDILYNIFKVYGSSGWEKALEAYQKGKIGARELYKRVLDGVKIEPESLKCYLDSFSLDPFFADFLVACRQHSLPLYILSDGLDFYIEYLLQQHKLDIPYFANHLQFNPNCTISINFPYAFEGCDGCGNCKLNIRETRWFNKNIIYIGDGFSDRCVAKTAQILFAKNTLGDFCRQNSLIYYPFSNFNNIYKTFIQLGLFNNDLFP